MTTGAPTPAIAREQQPDRIESNQPATQPVGTLLSVNVGLPKDMSWQGRIVFTGVFKDSVPDSRRVGRLNVDGDGQGDLAGHGASSVRCSFTRSTRIGTGNASLDDTTSCTDSSAKTSLWRDWPTRRCALATATRLAARSSR